MNSKLVRLVGIFAAAVVLGLGVAVQSSDAGPSTGSQVLAEDRGPASASPAPTP
ncbi:hypothetical protein AB0F18_00015 [Streptomyces sp. NPDC029216]|uniref:hypothetical protein n=1 Tax=Streptomyces sp. NPDC029216 TaxID=3154701 RepID=UPI0033E6FC35